MSFTQLLVGKRALITGASRGLGRSIAVVFAQHGADVAFSYSSDDAGAAETTAAITATGKRAHAGKVSVLNVDGLDDLVRTVEAAWGPIDILVNNAGVSQPLPLALLEESDWDQVMDVNAKGAYLAARAVLRGMIRRRKGVLLNIGSLAGQRMLEAPIHYAASKAALNSMTQTLCKEVGRYNIRVNCLAPGLLEEGVGQNLPDHRLQEYLKHVALHRRGTLAEIAELAAFMVSDRNSYMNGATVLADGGI